jgi:hypothetical protein
MQLKRLDIANMFRRVDEFVFRQTPTLVSQPRFKTGKCDAFTVTAQNQLLRRCGGPKSERSFARDDL